MKIFSAVLEVFYTHKQRDGCNNFKRHSPRIQISLKTVLLTDTGLLYVYKGTPVLVQNHTWKNCRFCFITAIAWGKLVAAFNLQTYFFFSCFLLSTLIHDIVQILASACYNLGNTKSCEKHIYVALNSQSACVITMPATLYSILFYAALNFMRTH
jgi:hypothetical protein